MWTMVSHHTRSGTKFEEIEDPETGLKQARVTVAGILTVAPTPDFDYAWDQYYHYCQTRKAV